VSFEKHILLTHFFNNINLKKKKNTYFSCAQITQLLLEIKLKEFVLTICKEIYIHQILVEYIISPRNLRFIAISYEELSDRVEDLSHLFPFKSRSAFPSFPSHDLIYQAWSYVIAYIARARSVQNELIPQLESRYRWTS
jgi:hypothetical protein